MCKCTYSNRITFPPRFNSLSLNLYEEMENHQKRTENQVIKYEQEQLSRANQYLALLQEKLVRAVIPLSRWER